MKKILLIIALAAVAMVSCDKVPGQEGGKKDGKMEVSKVEVAIVASCNETFANAFKFTFSGTGFDGKAWEYVLDKSGADGLVLCSKENPVLTENEKDNQFTVSLKVDPIYAAGYTPAAGEKLTYSFELQVNAYDKAGKLITDSGRFTSNSGESSNIKTFEAFENIVKKAAFEETRGVWMAKTTSGIWHIGADKL